MGSEPFRDSLTHHHREHLPESTTFNRGERNVLGPHLYDTYKLYTLKTLQNIDLEDLTIRNRGDYIYPTTFFNNADY